MVDWEQILSLDIGSGDAKGFFINKDGEEVHFKFPTAVRRVKETSTSFGADTSKIIEFEGQKYYVGEDAVDDAITTRAFDFHSKYSPIIAYKAILIAGFDITKPIILKTGITIKDWHESDNLIKRLSGFVINGEKLDTKVAGHFAQGQGSFIDEGSPKGEVLIVDGGYNTLDLIAFKNANPVAERCMATVYGANKMITNIQNVIQSRFHVDISEQGAKKIFNDKSFNILGENINMGETIKDEQNAYLEQLFIELRSKHGDYLKTVDEVIFTGGLAYFLQDAQLPKNARLGKAPYEYSNVRGYYYG